MSEKPFMTVEEVAAVLRIKPRTVQAICNSGKIGATKTGRRWLIPKESLDDYLRIVR